MKISEIRVTVEERAGDLAGSAQKAAKGLKDGAGKAAHAVVGAPVVVARRLSSYGGKVGEGIREELDAYIAEGEQLLERLRERDVVEDIKERVDLENLQDRVERLRDQLEEVLANWRESFRPHDDVPEAADAVAEAAAEAVAEPLAEEAAVVEEPEPADDES
jgi:hypothetical protein